MIALLYVLFFIVYACISFFVIYFSYRLTKKRFNQGWIGGVIATLVMYNLVFWDVIPVYVMHKHYCETEAGFWVYKSPKEWVDKHPEIWGQDWTDQKNRKIEAINSSYENNITRFWLSSEIYYELNQNQRVSYAINRREYKIVDANTGDVLIRSVNFGSSGQYKIWLRNGSCSDELRYKFDGELKKLIRLVKDSGGRS